MRSSQGISRILAAGCCATLLGVGLQRFAYAPLLPAMVNAGWLGPGAAGALGGANLAAYLFGALFAPRLAQALGLRPALRGCMAVVSICFAACSWPGGLAWFLPWRMLTGIAGGGLMVLAGPAIQAVVPSNRRGMAAGATFAGVGLGIVAGAVLVPAALPAGMSATWLALAAAGAVLTVLTWRWWPDAPPPPRRPVRGHRAGKLIACYALAAVAAAPHMLWWPDFVARGLGEPRMASATWLAYGIAAACGPALCGRAADRYGAGRALLGGLSVQVVALAVPLAADNPAFLLASAMLAGGTAIGITALALTRAKEIAGDAAPAVWQVCTAAFGAAQAVAGFVLAALYAATGSHLPLFAVGLAAAVLAWGVGRS